MSITVEFDSHLDVSLLTERDLTKIAERVEKVLASEQITLTMGGEPTFIPKDPEGPEWIFAADGPTKLKYANAFAKQVMETAAPEAMILYAPGKLYPGEVNPRWSLQILQHGPQKSLGIPRDQQKRVS